MQIETKTKLAALLGELRSFKTFAAEALADVPQISASILFRLDSIGNMLAHHAGEPLMADSGKPKFGPILENPAEVPKGSPEYQSPKEIATAGLNDDLDAIATTFLDRESDEILDSLNDIQLRGMAIKYGKMQDVTETEPERLTVEFVDKIKDAIKANREIDAAVATGSTANDNDGDESGFTDSDLFGDDADEFGEITETPEVGLNDQPENDEPLSAEDQKLFDSVNDELPDAPAPVFQADLNETPINENPAGDLVGTGSDSLNESTASDKGTNADNDTPVLRSREVIEMEIETAEKSLETAAHGTKTELKNRIKSLKAELSALPE